MEKEEQEVEEEEQGYWQPGAGVERVKTRVGSMKRATNPCR